MMRPGKVRFGRTAQRDLAEMLGHVGRDDPRAALRLIDDIVARCERLADFPEMGRLRPDLGRGVRYLPLGERLAFYRLEDRHVVVLRVIHGARNICHLF
ncbi:MAG: type II toxin-antitoxin system RelE/ParE family toxin [Alphaproteobacteria bacterium]|nr:type II toxin-antitoxin system RelE/ParE family toxin [Alphaproteobacteria bacterium]